MVTVLIMAKAPVAGQVKTRLCPPLSPMAAADLAAAALLDTLAAAGGVPAALTGAAAGGGARTVVALTGNLTHAAQGDAVREALAHCTLITQRGDGFAARLAAAHTDAGGEGPVLQIGMDTPQLTPALLAAAINTLFESEVDAVLGPANDGGWWALGLKSAAGAPVLQTIPMSQPNTYDLTLAALDAIGLKVQALPTLTDVDTFSDAQQVAAEAPETRFAARFRLLNDHPGNHQLTTRQQPD